MILKELCHKSATRYQPNSRTLIMADTITRSFSDRQKDNIDQCLSGNNSEVLRNIF